MIKVFIEGFVKTTAVVGHFKYEDERYIYLDDGGKQVRIPQDRVLMIEDWPEGVVSVGLPDGPPTPRDVRTPPVVSTSARMPLSSSFEDAVQRNTSDLGDQGFDTPVQFKSFDVVFSGYGNSTFSINAPAATSLDSYSPELGRLIFADVSVREFLSGDIQIDKAIPRVDAGKVYFQTKKREVMSNDVRAGLFSKLAGVTSLATDAGRKTIFEQGFSMPKSPFEQVPVLTGGSGEIDENS